MDELAAFLSKWDRKLFDGGWAAIWWPPEYGGTGASAIECAIYAEEMALARAPEGLGRLGKRLVGPILMADGTDTQKGHLPKILDGSEVWCQGFSEPDAGSDLQSIRTRATEVGDTWNITGQKVWTSFARYAQWCLVLARTGPVANRGAALSLFLVDMTSPGISVRPIETVTRDHAFSEVTFDNVVVSAKSLVGEPNKGWRIVVSLLQKERGSEFCLARLADVRRIFSASMAAVTARNSDDADAWTLGAFQTRIVAAQLSALDLLTKEVAGTVLGGLDSLVKLYVTETWRALGMLQVTSLAAEDWTTLGAQQVEDYFESQHYTISAGTSEVQRNAIARLALELPSARG
jgi:alkylation response protein AidB-like acyl-CoA dehydrogenase